MKKNKKSKSAMCIVKRKGHTEEFDERKAYGSCYFACRSCHLSEAESERICERVCKSLKSWIKRRKGVTSDQIFRHITKELKKHHEDVAFMYETHRDIS